MSEAQHCRLLQNEPVSVYHSIAGHGMTRHAADLSSTGNIGSAKG